MLNRRALLQGLVGGGVVGGAVISALAIADGRGQVKYGSISIVSEISTRDAALSLMSKLRKERRGG